MEDKRKLKTRIEWLCENKVNAFSPTISPAPKNKTTGELESIEAAVSYYMERGITDLVFQRKYMGSYCDIYLNCELELSYLVSRNGHRIHHIDMEEAWNALKSLHNRFEWDHTEWIILQSELLPWSVLGEGLIENEFKGYLHAHQVHYHYLKDSGLYEKLNHVKESEPYTTYQKTKSSKSNPAHITRQYEAIAHFPLLDLNIYEEGIQVYQKQIHHHGKESKMEFKPFNMLKKIGKDGQEEIPNSNLTYKDINDDSFIHLRLSPEQPLRPQLEEVYTWFHALAENMEEGIMVKPSTAFIKGIPPAFKVRNNNYLTMIYGVDFMQRYEHHLQKRTISRKLECSVNDWMLNWELIKTPYKEINQNNYYFKNLLLDRILGEQIENELDHRL